MLKKFLFLIGVTLIILTTIYIKSFNNTPNHLYKIISTKNWEQSQLQDNLVLPSMDDDFIHLSTKKQLEKIINKFWKNETEFFVLKLDVKKLPGKLTFEFNPGGSQKYYHLYDGYIPITSIISVSKVTK